MPATWTRSSAHLLSILLIWVLAVDVHAASSSFRQSVVVEQGGNPAVHLTNDSDVPITAFIMVEFPSLGMEGRTYFDTYIGSRDETIAPGASVTRYLSSFHGFDAHKIRAEIRGVVFKDGSTAGDPVWVNAILARRVRLHDRFRRIHDLLSHSMGGNMSRKEVIDLLKIDQADAELNLADDDLRVMDVLALYGAISTFETNRETKVDIVLKVYLKDLEKRMLLLEYSRPDLESVRTLPLSTPAPLSDDSLPEDFVASRARFESADGATPSLSYCSVLASSFSASPDPQTVCAEGPVNQKFTFSTEFTRYDASTNQTANVPWSSAPGHSPYSAFGLCIQFVDCDGDPDIFYKRGDQQGQGAANPILINPTKVQQGQSAKSFYWLLDNYPQPSFSPCDECDLNPNGVENPVSINAPVPSTQWSFNYACVVSP